MMKVYIIENTVTGKKYVGITSRSIEERFTEHIQAAASGKKTALYASMRKHGTEAFTVTEAGVAEDWQSLCTAEKELIQKLQTQCPNGYNQTSGGDGVLGLSAESIESMRRKNTGRKHTPEAREKISKAGRGRKVSAETRQKISEGHKSKTLTPEHRGKLSQAKIGKKLPPRSPEHAQRISEGLRKNWLKRKSQNGQA